MTASNPTPSPLPPLHESQAMLPSQYCQNLDIEIVMAKAVLSADWVCLFQFYQNIPFKKIIGIRYWAG